MDPQWIFYSLYKQPKNHVGTKLPKKERWTHISIEKGGFGHLCGSINGSTLPKKEILMACITNSKTILKQNFQKRKFLMGPTLPKKRNFDGLHKQLKNLFGIKITKKGNFNRTHITESRKYS
jgi:hypothetical protein